MAVRPGSIRVGDVVQVDPRSDEQYAGVLLVVNEVHARGIQGYYVVPGSLEAENEDMRVACSGHYDTTFAAVTLVTTKAPYTVAEKIFVCPCCQNAVNRREVKVCGVCEADFCSTCKPHRIHKPVMHARDTARQRKEQGHG